MIQWLPVLAAVECKNLISEIALSPKTLLAPQTTKKIGVDETN